MASGRLTLAINLGNGAISQYDNYDFDSYAVNSPDGVYYAANSDGLYTLNTADTDNTSPIACHIKSMDSEIVPGDSTNLMRGYLNYRSESEVNITLYADGVCSDIISVPNNLPSGKWHTDYFTPDLGLFGNQWAVKIANTGGRDLSIRSLHFILPSRKPAQFMRGVAGLNTLVDPAVIASGVKSGLSEAAELVNMYVDDGFAIHRRPGYTLLQSGVFHSLFCARQSTNVYVIKDRTSDAALYRVTPTGTLVGIRSGLEKGTRVFYTEYNGSVYYSDGVKYNGVLNGDTSAAWPFTPPHSSELTLQKEFYAAPCGSLMTTFKGRVYMAERDVIWRSEYGNPSRWRKSVYFKLEGDITLLEAAGDGIYVSDSRQTYFFVPTIQSDVGLVQSLKICCGYPAIKGTSAVTETSRILGGRAFPGTEGNVVIWASNDGVCVGGPTGVVINLTEKKVLYPKVIEGAGAVMHKHGEKPGMPVLYVVSMK
jgi:hypothetical protein